MALSHQDMLDHVKEQIRIYTGKKKVFGDYAFVLCPWHSEVTPSARVFYSNSTKYPGYTKCYGCGKSGGWNKAAPLLGLQPFTYQPPQVEYTTKILTSNRILEEVTPNFQLQKMKSYPLPINRLWRGIKTSLLIDIGAYLACFYNEEYGWSKQCIFLPIYINKVLEGYIKASIKKQEGYPSYINAKGSWSKTHGLFPYDYAVKTMVNSNYKTMVLVEGPRDALRLLSLGIPAISILGTQSWCEYKVKLLSLAPIKNILLMMDGDDAGINATKGILPTLKPYFNDVKAIKLWDYPNSPYMQFIDYENPSKTAKLAEVSLWDPANCPVAILYNIKDTL